jgi:pSer/pThr/pTyr-binding forkhead associated (FHA) protein/tetratricopeptide (TPR) repeat protein
VPASSAQGRIFIIVRAPNGDVREVPVTATAVVIGRDESADIRVEDKKVSRRHAAFKLLDGEPWVEDLGSANGVKLNGKRIDKRAKITAQDTIKVGGYRITLRDLSDSTGSSVVDDDRAAERVRGPVSSVKPPVARDATPPRPPPDGVRGSKMKKPSSPPDDGRSPVLIGLDDPVKGQRFVVRLGENIIGRLEECDVPVLDGSVSRQHARIVFSRERLSVTDLGASNGTFVNDVRIEMAELANADLLRVGNVRFKLELAPELSKQLSSPKARARSPQKRGARPWATAGIAVLLLAIAVLSATIYWKWRARHEGRSLGGSHLIEEDAGTAVVVNEVVILDAGAPIVRVEPKAPVDAGVVEVKPDAGAKAVVKAPVDAGEKPRVVKATPDSGAAPIAKPAEPPDAGAMTAALPVHPIATATSPYGRRDTDGLPLDLPSVDPDFDFSGFVDEQVGLAEQFEKDGDYRRVRTVVVGLLDRDPINPKGKAIFERLQLHETAEQAFSQAEKLEAKGNYPKALKLYSAVPENAPEAPRAKAKIDELKPKAVELELARADKELLKKATWPKAHKDFIDVLEIDPESSHALKGVRTVERKMRAKNMRFTAYVPPNAKEPMVKESPEEVDDAIAKRYAGEEDLAKVARIYARNDPTKALKKAEAIEKKSDGQKKEDAKKIRVALKQIVVAHERIRNEIGNNPSEAWAKLRDLENLEANILPGDVKSYVRKELEESIAEAFGDKGASDFEHGRYTESFVSWSAGYKLDPLNPKVTAGLKKLEEHAKHLADEAELAGQRGEKGVCEKWKTITRMTRPESDVYKRAYERAKNCPV